MKTCPYCGKQYPDEVIACAIDGESLSPSHEVRKKIHGVWRGVYGYAGNGNLAKLNPVRFTLKLEQGWLEHFTGTVTEDAPDGMPGTGIIDGYYQSPTIEFTKQMPVGYITDADGGRMTFRDYVISQGHQCDHELPSSPIFYQGSFLDANRVQGLWEIKPHKIPLKGGLSVTGMESTGLWCAEFITTDLKSNPTSGPGEPFFDISLLPQPESPPEKEQQNDPALRSLGKFSVADAEDILKRFEKAGIKFEINRDDTALSQMPPVTAATGGYSGMAPMIEIFVSPEDEAKAIENMG